MPDTTQVGRTTSRQVGGSHYKDHAIQPWQIWEEYRLDPWLASAVKYILRDKDNNKREDIEKAIHTLEHWIDLYDDAYFGEDP